ncbi:winged helix-turn-helix domain-containing protein [Streptomyces sp. NPDC048638]|uniref:winged helix-turn-helix domain-containing protein n=1 Tax=Streptomyces sp. NPDC048638 TaxID=3365580 RepID=UPI00371477B0
MPRTTKYEQVADRIRHAIKGGDPGEALPDIVDLAHTYEVSRATVTKALEVLRDQGSVQPGDAGGYVIPPTRTVAVPASREAPEVLSGRVITEHIDPDAERALKRPEVAQAYQEGRELGRAWVAAEGRATEAKRALSVKLMDMREMFQHKGHLDWNGQSREYQALAALLYQDLGVDMPAQRAVLHHLEDRKRERVPKALWPEFGVEELTRGQRAGLGRKAAKALTEVSQTADAAAGQAAKGKTTGHQLVTLAKRIDQGMAVFSTASLRVLTPKQRQTFRDEVKAARDHADALLRELEGLDE